MAREGEAGAGDEGIEGIAGGSVSAPADQSGQRCAACAQRVCLRCIERVKETQALRAEADRLRHELRLRNIESDATWADNVMGGLVGIGFAAVVVGVLWALGRIATVIGGAS